MKVRTLAMIICILAIATTGISVLADGPQEGPKPRREQAGQTWEREAGVMVRPSAGAMFHGNLDGDQFLFVSSEMSFDGKVVKDAPYSAVAVTESIQTLADGNRIVNKRSASVHRDSAGRTRREQSLGRIGPYSSAADTPNTILINDPVAEVNYILEPNSRTARKMTLQRKVFDVRVSTEEGLRRKEAHVGPSTPEDHIRFQRGYELGRKELDREQRVHTEVAVGSGAVMIARSGGKGRITPSKESLGKQMIEGVEAEGTRITMTIAAGEIGNEQPINMISEQWYSPELQTVIMSRHSDPRSGETVYRLTGISRNEPAASLFEVPADYTIKEGIAPEARVELERKLRRKTDNEQ